MRQSMRIAALAGILWAGTVSGQNVPQIAFTAAPFLTGMPDNIHLGEVAGVARNSRGEIFVYTRTGNPTVTLGAARSVSHGGSRLFQFDSNGNYMRELGIGVYGFLYAQQVRVDHRDNVWVVDQQSGQVMRFDTNGRIVMVFSRKPEALNPPTTPARGAGPAPAAGAPAAGAAPPAAPPAAAAGRGGGGGGRAAGAGTAGESFNRPADVAVDADGFIYVADGLGNNARIAKYDPEGRWIMNWGSRGTEQSQFDGVSGIQIDAAGLIYVSDRGNGRIQVFNREGVFQRQFTVPGNPQTICISPGSPQYLYVSNSNTPDNIDERGEIYRMDLNGRVLGRFGRAGRLPGEFNAVNSIDCRVPNQLLVGEVGSWRVQRVTLR